MAVPVLVFFGYTHCPDVCPATIGSVGQAIDAYGKDARAIFVSVDPERDTVPWLAEFVRFMPAGFTAVTGTPAEVKAAADDWGVRYAKVEEADPANYSMSHTADVFLVDAAGQLRARFPFGTEPETMTAVLREVAATTPDPHAIHRLRRRHRPPTEPSAAPVVTDLRPRVVSSSVWAGGASPVILSLFDGAGKRVDDPGLRVTAQLLDPTGAPVGPPVAATGVTPEGATAISYVPTLDIPTPGRWQVALEAVGQDGTTRHGIAVINALDPGGSAALGKAAPDRPHADRSRLRRRPEAGHHGPAPGPAALGDLHDRCPGGPGTVRAGRRLRPVQGDAGLRQGRAPREAAGGSVADDAVHPPRAVPLRRGDLRARHRGIDHRSAAHGTGRGLGRRSGRRGASGRCRGSSSWMGMASSGRSTRGSSAARTSTSSCRCWPRNADPPIG